MDGGCSERVIIKEKEKNERRMVVGGGMRSMSDVTSRRRRQLLTVTLLRAASCELPSAVPPEVRITFAIDNPHDLCLVNILIAQSIRT